MVVLIGSAGIISRYMKEEKKTQQPPTTTTKMSRSNFLCFAVDKTTLFRCSRFLNGQVERGETWYSVIELKLDIERVALDHVPSSAGF